MIVINFYGGPGVGKSTTATWVFSALKGLGVNAEYVPEFAKDGAWEKRPEKFFRCQQYLYGTQSWRLERLIGECDVAVTDSPLLLNNAYNNGPLTALADVVFQDYSRYENMDFYLKRKKAYNPRGRNQDEEGAKVYDKVIENVLKSRSVSYFVAETAAPGDDGSGMILDTIKAKLYKAGILT